MRNKPTAVWTLERWEQLFENLRRCVLSAESDKVAWLRVAAAARLVLKTYSTSFFLVTRFLPTAKRRQVDVIYAAVRYPDELVDTFGPSGLNAEQRLDSWSNGYTAALGTTHLRETVAKGVNPFLAAFVEVIRRNIIPHGYYCDFLGAMRCDLQPSSFTTLTSLIDEYVYGSAVVVGYFLTYVYGASTPGNFSRATSCAKNLGIALQLTNFARDIYDDQLRGRLYVPQDVLAATGALHTKTGTVAHQAALADARRQLAHIAEDYYERATSALDAYSVDSRIAIKACINVYRQLNMMILTSSNVLPKRYSVPVHQKFLALPASKYWRLPLAYMGWL